jgi:hypothetical protein
VSIFFVYSPLIGVSNYTGSVLFTEPAGARMYYVSGNNTRFISFKYTVSTSDNTDALSFGNATNFKLDLFNAYFQNLYGQTQQNITAMPADIRDLSAITINAKPPKVGRVDSDSPDEFYYPGQTLDLKVTFDKVIMIIPPNATTVPCMSVFAPSLPGRNNLACYTGGNMTKTLHFLFVIPPPMSVVYDPIIPFDYVDTAALTEHMNGCIFYEYTMNSIQRAETTLPPSDQSYLGTHRDIMIDYVLPSVESVYCVNDTGIYTAGDTVVIAVKFTQSVMVSAHPPVLRLNTSNWISPVEPRNAVYVSGNHSKILLFSLFIIPGDTSADLEYVDTRLPPFNMKTQAYAAPRSFALNTDIIASNTARLFGNVNYNRFDDIVVIDTAYANYGGVFVDSEHILVPIDSSLPLPGNSGSLSSNSAIIIDTTPPEVQKVFTNVPSGTYGGGANIIVNITFNFAVVVGGCPTIHFLVSNRDRYAVYFAGSGSRTLSFLFAVQPGDLVTSLDYRNRFALANGGCTEEETLEAMLTNAPLLYIKRYSQNPIIVANYTLPWINYVESVVAPTSITATGKAINFSPNPIATVMRVYSDNADDSRTYFVGDVIDVNIEFSRPVTTLSSLNILINGLDRPLYVDAAMTSEDMHTLTFPLAILLNESRGIPFLTYPDEFALRSYTSCDIVDALNGACASQLLPYPLGHEKYKSAQQQRAGSADSLTPVVLRLDDLSIADITLDDVIPAIVSVYFQTFDVFLGEESPAGSYFGVPVARGQPPGTSDDSSDDHNNTVVFFNCDAFGNSFYYNELVDPTSLKRVVYTTTCPNHYAACQYANCSGDVPPVSAAVPQPAIIEIPLYPVLANSSAKTIESTSGSTAKCLTGTVGFAVNGVPISSPYTDDTACENVVPSLADKIDKCGGIADELGVYSYRIPPVCLLKQLGAKAGEHSPQIGWALDGFPIYGGHGPNGVAMRPCIAVSSNVVSGSSSSGSSGSVCLDECNGYAGALPGVDEFIYRYYIIGEEASGECAHSVGNTDAQHLHCDNDCCVSRIPSSAYAPYSIGCFKGCKEHDTNCVLATRIEGYTSSYVPKPSSFVTGVYDGTDNTLQAVYTAQKSQPLLFMPSPVWDTVITNTVNLSTFFSALSSGTDMSHETMLPPMPVYPTGSMLGLIITFNVPIIIEGEPVVSLEFDSDGDKIVDYDSFIVAKFSRQLDPTSIQFQFPVPLNRALTGVARCARSSVLDTNGGRILRAANFLPMVESPYINLGSVCCSDAVQDTCFLAANVVQKFPYVTRVYGLQAGTFSSPDVISIFVDFSTPVTVLGFPVLQLDLEGLPNAVFTAKAGPQTLEFRYTVTKDDVSSAVDYYGVDSLILSGGPFDGIFMDGVYTPVPANITLPERGAVGSLGIETVLVIDNTRADLLSISAFPAAATSGDFIIITLTYSDVMILMDADGNRITSFTQTDSTAQDASNFVATMAIRIVPLAGSTVVREMYVTRINGRTLSFSYEVTNADPTGTVYIANSAPFVFGNGISFKSLPTFADGPTTFSLEFISQGLAIVDNVVPRVVSVFSPNVTVNYPFGLGDMMIIYVEMSLPVIVSVVPTLSLALNNRIATAIYVPNVEQLNATGYETILEFEYLVANGDEAMPLEYNGNFALSGELLRFSTNVASLISNLTLPNVFSPGSLGYCCNVRIDFTPPFVSSLIPLKRPNIYGANEEIVIIARFTKPVVVTGTPILYLKTTESATNNEQHNANAAYYVDSYEASDIPIVFEETDMLFLYIVKLHDNTISLTHVDTASFYLPSGTTILQKTQKPSVPADLLLRAPLDRVPTGGLIDRQWNYRSPAKVEVLLRGLYHTNAGSLTVTLEHSGQFATLVDSSGNAACAGKTFGHSFPRSKYNTNTTRVTMDAGIGYTYLFADTLSPNIARQASYAAMSSFNTRPLLAIDGNNDPILGDGSVAQSNDETDPWFELLLPIDATVQTINIWPRLPQQWIAPEVAYTIKGLDAYPIGRYKLQFTDINDNNSTEVLTTDFIFYGAEANSVKAAIEGLSGIGKVTVSRHTLPLCGVEHPGGCGEGFEKGYGFTYYITFLNLIVQRPVLTIVGSTFVGGPVVDGAFGETENVEEAILVSHVNVIRVGEYQAVQNIGNTSQTTNQWLTPYYVMLFDEAHSPPPLLLNESLKVAMWSALYTTIGPFQQIILPNGGIKASYLKIQRSGYGQLALAEVEIFQDKVNTLSSYQKGSPVEQSALTVPYQPNTPFFQAYRNTLIDGRWLIRLTQSRAQSSGKPWNGVDGDYGTVSEAVMIITDLSGIVHVYYQDIRAQVTSLPKYGTLFDAAQFTPSPYGDWREAFEVSNSGQSLQPKFGFRRNLGVCYGSNSEGATQPFRYCADNYGNGIPLDLRVLGDTADYNSMRHERVVAYVPATHYLGPDYFEYIIYDGLSVQNHISWTGLPDSVNQVTTHVRNCRRVAAQMTYGVKTVKHPLCVCADTERGMINNTLHCFNSLETICAANSTSRKDFLNPCLACIQITNTTTTLAGGQTTETTTTYSYTANGECLAQIGRAVSMLNSIGLCSSAPAMDCNSEQLTMPGNEIFNYLTLSPPMLEKSFTMLGNGVGAVGWFKSAAPPV